MSLSALKINLINLVARAQMRGVYQIFNLACLVIMFNSCSPEVPKNPIFQLISSEHSNIDFQNTLFETDSVNVLDFEFMFNGGGVAIGDIDNDGLDDIYFTGNQVSGKLYHNQGDMQFKDISAEANLETTGWCNGVAMCDINQDGHIDMYISRGGPRNTPLTEMSNLLYINQGDGTFTESAKKYGLADTGYSIQSVFFDYDKDGDEDLYLLTNALVPFNRNNSRPKVIDGKALSTDRLYRNNGNDTFTDISEGAGITIEGFGLGAAVCDLNQDGRLDIYVSNDFMTNDILYINNGDGTFTNKIAEYLKHQSYNGMGLSISDINNDALSDIMVLDMLPQDNKRLKQTIGYFSYDKLMLDTDFGYMPQHVRNTLQLNNGNTGFSEIGQLSGIHATDWSWCPLIADFDNDGHKDVFITNGYRRDVTNLDFINYGQQQGPFGNPKSVHEDRLKKLKALPEVKLHNYVYKNNGDLTFTDKSLPWGIGTPSYSNGAAYGDLDNDGDLDLVINNIDDKAHVYRNNTIAGKTKIADSSHYVNIKLKGSKSVVGTEVTLYYQGTLQHQRFSPVRGYLSSVENELHFGLGRIRKIDSVTLKWPDGINQRITNVSVDTSLTFTYNKAMLIKKSVAAKSSIFEDVTKSLGIRYLHRESKHVDFNSQATLLRMNSRLGPGMAVGDVNADGLEDFYVGGGMGHNGSFFLQQKDGNFKEKILDNGELHEDMGALLLDSDKDGDLDLLVISGGERSQNRTATDTYTDRIYRNDGSGNFTQDVFLEREHSGSFIKASDYDKDGDLDLFIGARYVDGSYPVSPKSYVLNNDNGVFVNITESLFSNQGEFGMLSDALWTDFDNDNAVDLILVGEFMSPLFYKNYNGKFENVSAQTGIEHASGWWNSIVSGDFDNDGDIDYVLGNLGLNSSYKATATEPITLYAKDFDSNGAIDPVLTSYRQGIEQLIHPRDVLNRQIVAMKSRFRTFEAYADTPFDRSFLKEELQGALKLQAKMMSSIYLQNLSNGKFESRRLPLAAQFAPVFGMQVQDFNNDSHLDVLMIGNLYATEALTGAYDAFSGLCLLGDGKGNFSASKPSDSGLRIDGDAKAVVQLRSGNGTPLVLASQNLGPVKAYTYKSDRKPIAIRPNEVHAIVHLKNGNRYKKEFSYGDSYLSQSSRTLYVDSGKTDYVEVYSYQGQLRKIYMTDEK